MSSQKWYSGVTRYQWLILLVASLGWAFDAFEGQVFNLTRADMLSELLEVPKDHPDVKYWGEVFLGVFLAGGTLGGLLFGSLGDKIGRKPVMVITILFYSIFSGLTYFATDLWQVGVLRFLVAMGVGGEWAVAAALVSEVFPKAARTHAGGIFHATGVIGTSLAGIVSMQVGEQWRYAYLIGILPALLTLWVRSSVAEPKQWQEAKTKGEKMGSYTEMFKNPIWRTRALLGMALAAVGLGTFWGVCIATQDLTRELLLRLDYTEEDAAYKAKFVYSIVQVIGVAVGQLSFGPLCARFGRKPAFVWMHLLSFVMVIAVCWAPSAYWHMLVLTPLLGFAALSIHAGYAIYFPELFPNHLRATGSSFCFNAGRLIAVPMLLISGMVKSQYSLPFAISMLGCLFLVGVVILFFLPETKDQDLPE